MDATPNSRLPRSIFLFMAVVGAVQAFSYASRIPQTLASHFRGGGMANGWQSKLTFFGTELTVVVLASVIAFGLPRILGAVPVALINVPNKEYWFGPEQRERTLAFFNSQFAWFGCALLAFLLFVIELVFRANLRSPRQLNTHRLRHRASGLPCVRGRLGRPPDLAFSQDPQMIAFGKKTG